MIDKGTMTFSLNDDKNDEMSNIMRDVYAALKEKGYDPVNQIVGYIMSSNDLRQSVDSELRTTVSREAMELDGWLREKKAFGVATTNYMTSLNGNYEVMHNKATLGTTISDKEILEMTGGTEDGWWMGYYTGIEKGQISIDDILRRWGHEQKP